VAPQRFHGRPITSPRTTELHHRSLPTLNSLSGYAIEQAGSAQLKRLTSGSRTEFRSIAISHSRYAARFRIRAGRSLMRLLHHSAPNAPSPPPLEKLASLPHSVAVTAGNAGGLGAVSYDRPLPPNGKPSIVIPNRRCFWAARAIVRNTEIDPVNLQAAHRSRPAFSSLSGRSIERAGSAKRIEATVRASKANIKRKATRTRRLRILCFRFPR